MLDDLCEQHGYSRKHAIKPLGDAQPKPQDTPPPGPGPERQPMREVLKRI